MSVVLIAGSIGYIPTRNTWGEPGIRSMIAAGLICSGSALAGAMPMAWVAPRYPSYIGQAVLAGTTLRLLLTGAIGATYQKLVSPQLGSFLLWAMVFYISLLVVESIFGVLAVRRYYQAPSKDGGVVA